MFNGYKTYAGLIIALAGILGLTKYIAPEDLESLIRASVEVFGILFAAYGRWDRENR